MRQDLIDITTLQIHGKTYHVQHFYPLGLSHPQFRMWYVWEPFKPGITFTSDSSFESWRTRTQATPVQATLW